MKLGPIVVVVVVVVVVVGHALERTVGQQHLLLP